MSARRQIRILIVEDQELARLGLKVVLQQHADISIVAEASDGQDAVALTLEIKPDIVLMDIGLPTIDGIEACRQIREVNDGIRLIMLTSHDHDEDIFAALAAGADGYCLKQTSPEQLVVAIHAVMSGAGWLDPGIAGRVLRQVVSAVSPKVSGEHSGKFALSAREVDVLRLVVEGQSNSEIAASLFVSQETVKTHMRHIMEKLTVSDRTQAAVKALRQGLI